jgi:hypothetical protein
MSVAALEMLAAQAVAELGTYPTMLAGARPAAPDAVRPREPLPEDDVVATAQALVPPGQRARFEALFVALGTSATGKTWSPAARAARALALAGHGHDAPTSARERAAAAWDVLPIVHGADEPGALTTSTSAHARARSVPEPTYVAPSPGLAALTARAGEALGSYLVPAAAPAPPPTPAVPSGPASRAPTAAPELVRTGRPAGRHGGGEVEIPAWFETAARKMLDDRSGPSEGISLAELTLVSAAPATQVAASTRSMPSATPPAPAPSTQGGPITPHFDVEKIAHEVYHHILQLMDAARDRNGEPYL